MTKAKKQNKRRPISANKKTTSSAKSGISVTVVDILRSDHFKFVFGVMIMFIGIFMLLSIVSLFSTGAADQSLIQHKSFFQLAFHKTENIANWMGAGGAYIGEKFVNGWFGIFSILIPLFIIFIGLRKMKVVRCKWVKTLIVLFFSMICGSIASAFILNKLFPNSYINWGGTHGNEMEQLLEGSIGWPGLILFIMLFILVILLIARKSLVMKLQQKITSGRNNAKDESPNNEVILEIDSNQNEYDSKIIKNKKKISFLSKLFTLFRKKKEKDKEEDTDDKRIYEDVATNQYQTQEETIITSVLDIPIPTNDNMPDPSKDFEVVVPKEEEIVPTDLSRNEPILNPTTNSKTDENGEPLGGEEIGLQENYDPRKDLSTFEFPTLSILKTYSNGVKEVDMEEQNENKNKIIDTLRNYGIEITSIKATVGPTITLYEIVPKAGIRISKIKNLEDDIALGLKALGIRIIAPMPGKGTIGIEVPNKDPQIVSMQSVISSRKFQECTYELPVALGKTITNEVFIFDLAKMPHLLVAGATGQGKSVGLNAIITSLLYKRHPSEMKMVLVDPKMVEFNIYSTIERHYLAKLPDEEKAIITDVSKVTQTLNSLTKEMDDRYELLMRAKVRTIKEYNEKFVNRRLNPNNGHRYMPYIVVVIDEFGDLIMTAGKEIEMPIARIAQKARAVGMHMVIATQRPTTNIITGTIKANFPARMAFRVTSQIDSRTILDMPGANQLIGRGDMLFSQGSNLIRIQCAFVDTPEVEEIAQYIGNQRGYENAFALPEVLSAESDEKISGSDLNDRDSLFDEAARLIVINQQGSTSLIQRKFSIGYNRAGRLMDQMERAGIVGPTQGSKPREVYIADEYSLEKKLNMMK